MENFKSCIPYSSWPSRELRVERNTHRLLDLFDSASFKFQVSSFKIRATFFILGWIADRLPGLVREIRSRGHEIASHGHAHSLPTALTHKEFKTDLLNSKKILEDMIGQPVYGYRAPSFAIDNDILEIIRACGYLYDASYNSFSLHGRYGKINLPGNNEKGIALQIPRAPTPKSGSRQDLTGAALSRFYELPISNFQFPISNFHSPQFVLPWGGGAYLRLIPEWLFQKGVQSILRQKQAYLLYLHPWELDPNQPRVRTGAWKKFRHYTNLRKTEARLTHLFSTFSYCRFISCKDYLARQMDN